MQEHAQENKRVKDKLDNALIQLAGIMKELGIEEVFITEDYQHHISSTERQADQHVIDDFCIQIQQLYKDIVLAKH